MQTNPSVDLLTLLGVGLPAGAPVPGAIPPEAGAFDALFQHVLNVLGLTESDPQAQQLSAMLAEHIPFLTDAGAADPDTDDAVTPVDGSAMLAEHIPFLTDADAADPDTGETATQVDGPAAPDADVIHVPLVDPQALMPHLPLSATTLGPGVTSEAVGEAPGAALPGPVAVAPLVPPLPAAGESPVAAGLPVAAALTAETPATLPTPAPPVLSELVPAPPQSETAAGAPPTLPDIPVGLVHAPSAATTVPPETTPVPGVPGGGVSVPVPVPPASREPPHTPLVAPPVAEFAAPTAPPNTPTAPVDTATVPTTPAGTPVTPVQMLAPEASALPIPSAASVSVPAASSPPLPAVVGPETVGETVRPIATSQAPVVTPPVTLAETPVSRLVDVLLSAAAPKTSSPAAQPPPAIAEQSAVPVVAIAPTGDSAPEAAMERLAAHVEELRVARIAILPEPAAPQAAVAPEAPGLVRVLGGEIGPLALTSGIETADKPTSVHVETPSGAPTQPTTLDRLPDQLVRTARFLARGHGGVVRLRLEPQALGRLTVHVMQNHDTLVVELAVQSNQVREVLQDQLPQLRQQLADQGLTLSALTVSTETGGHEEPADRQAAHAASQYGRVASRDAAESVPDGESPMVRPPMRAGRLDLVA